MNIFIKTIYMKHFLYSIITFLALNLNAQTDYNDKIMIEPNLCGTIYTQPEVMPQPKGGIDSIYSYIKSNFIYPKFARQNELQGWVKISFIVDAEGNRSNFSIVEDLGGGLGDEIIRMFQTMPPFMPGRNGENNVCVLYTISVNVTFEGFGVKKIGENSVVPLTPWGK
jgi:hypothetical protein